MLAILDLPVQVPLAVVLVAQLIPGPIKTALPGQQDLQDLLVIQLQ